MENTAIPVAATLNIIAIIADALMVLFLIREPLSYFRAYKSYFVTIYAFFNAFPISQIVLAFDPNDQALIRLTTQAFAASAAIIATLWGLLVTKLYYYPENFSLRSAIASPFKGINMAFLLYLVPMATLVALTIGDPNSVDPSPTRTAFYAFDGTIDQAVGLSPLLLTVASIVITCFSLYSFVVLSRLRSELKDREVRGALRVIASSFAAISTLLLFGYAAASFGYSILGLVHLTCVILLIVAVRGFKRPTFLRAFLGVVPSLGSHPNVLRGDQIVLIYENGEAKITPIARFINEGVNQQNRVLFFHSNDEASAREELSRSGVDVKYHLTKGNLRLPSVDSLYQGEGLLDEESAIGQCVALAGETRALGRNGLRVVIDFGDQTKHPYQKFVNHIADPRWATPDHYVQVMMTFSSHAFDDEKPALDLLKSKVPVIDLTESTDLFSRTVGLSHDELAGKKILLEYDPLSDYERTLRTIATEAVANFERVILFTRKDSPVHSSMEKEPGLKMFVLTSRVSYPKMESENVVLIPAFDSSLILDSLNRTIEAYSATPFTIIFDNISHQIFTIGTERAHSFVRQALELMASNRITGIFLVNYGAHDPKTVSMFENLFDLELISRAGARIPEVRKKIGLSA